jgi:DUF4097 and DUF4098 domain-containing protein YvlB
MITKRALATLSAAILIGILGGSVALAGQPLNEKKGAAADGLVQIENISGSVEVIGWDEPMVQVTGELGDGTKGLTFNVSDKRTRISVDLPGGRNVQVESTDLIVHVPRRSEVRVETVSADIEARELLGVVQLESVSGDLDLEGSPLEAELETVSGRVELRSAGELRRGSFESVSGNILVDTDFAVDGRYTFATVSGNVKLLLSAGVSADFDVETFSGDIVNELGPPARKSSIHLPAKELRFTAGAGGARVKAESVSGKVELRKR